MIVSIAQPTVFPWIGYFNIIKNSDVFVFLDIVKFEKSSWQMRNRLKEASKDKDGEVWIRLPTKSVKSDTAIKDVLLDNSQDWMKTHVKTFRINYGSSFDEVDFLKSMYDKTWDRLAAFNMDAITSCCKYLDVRTKIFKASDLPVGGHKSQLVLNICKEFGATEYLSTVGSREYLDKDMKIFEDAQVKIKYHDYTHPVYKQKGKTFLPYMSVLDLIFNEKENARNFI